MKLTRNKQQEVEAENTLPLINIVFLSAYILYDSGQSSEPGTFSCGPAFR